MAQVSKYRYLLNQYPETVQKEQFRIICHISKRTARYLLQSGLVPCVQSGKKTRNYTIKMKDIVRYDYIIVDTNPSLGSLTINALTAADEVIIPIDPELFALTGLQALVDTIKKIKRKLNPSIEIGGILFTKCNKRTNLYRRTYG